MTDDGTVEPGTGTTATTNGDGGDRPRGSPPVRADSIVRRIRRWIATSDTPSFCTTHELRHGAVFDAPLREKLAGLVGWYLVARAGGREVSLVAFWQNEAFYQASAAALADVVADSAAGFVRELGPRAPWRRRLRVAAVIPLALAALGLGEALKNHYVDLFQVPDIYTEIRDQTGSSTLLNVSQGENLRLRLEATNRLPVGTSHVTIQEVAVAGKVLGGGAREYHSSGPIGPGDTGTVDLELRHDLAPGGYDATITTQELAGYVYPGHRAKEHLRRVKVWHAGCAFPAAAQLTLLRPEHYVIETEMEVGSDHPAGAKCQAGFATPAAITFNSARVDGVQVRSFEHIAAKGACGARWVTPALERFQRYRVELFFTIGPGQSPPDVPDTWRPECEPVN